VDRTLLREALKLTPGQRLLNLQQLCEGAEQLRLAGKTIHCCPTQIKMPNAT